MNESRLGRGLRSAERRQLRAELPLRPSHVWSIRTKLQIEGKKRDLALFNLAIDSKLRGCDVVAVRVDDVAPSGYSMDRATIQQKKTGRPVRFELTDQTRQAIGEYLRLTGRKSGQFLFAGRGDRGGLTTRQYAARLAQEWVPVSDSIQRSSAHTRSGDRRRC
jgi:integrase